MATTATTEAAIYSLMALMKRGDVTLSLHDPAPPRSPVEKADTPYVRVTHDGRTWQQPIMRHFGGDGKSTPGQIFEALCIAMDRVEQPHVSDKAASAADDTQGETTP